MEGRRPRGAGDPPCKLPHARAQLLDMHGLDQAARRDRLRIAGRGEGERTEGRIEFSTQCDDMRGPDRDARNRVRNERHRREAASSRSEWTASMMSPRPVAQRTIRRDTFRSIPQLKAAIQAFIDAHQANLKPFVWTKSTDETLASIARSAQRTSRTTNVTNHGLQDTRGTRRRAHVQ